MRKTPNSYLCINKVPKDEKYPNYNYGRHQVFPLFIKGNSTIKTESHNGYQNESMKYQVEITGFRHSKLQWIGYYRLQHYLVGLIKICMVSK
jgi:hypothetical protein